MQNKLKKKGKLFLIAATAGLAALFLCGCQGNNASDDVDMQGKEQSFERYSVSGVAVDEAPNPTEKYDISFLHNKNLDIQNACWLDDTRLLLITAKPAAAAEEDEGNLPREAEVYIFHSGDSSLTRCFAGELPMGKVKLLSGGEIGISNTQMLTFFDPAKGEITQTINIPDGSEADIAPSGEMIAYIDVDGKLYILDREENMLLSCAADSLGYNWFSTVRWSADGKKLAAFVSYEPYLNDNIAVIDVETGEGTVLDYEGAGDIYHYWPKSGANLLVLRNFFWGDPDTIASVDVVDLGSGRTEHNYPLVRSEELISIQCADANKQLFAFVYNGALYIAQHNKNFDAISPPELALYEDNTFVSPSIKRAAGIDYNTMMLYIISL